jgi:hypothetical protein
VNQHEPIDPTQAAANPTQENEGWHWSWNLRHW